MRPTLAIPRYRQGSAANLPSGLVPNRGNPITRGLDFLWMPTQLRGASPDIAARAVPLQDSTFNWSPLSGPSGYGPQYGEWSAASTAHMAYTGNFTVMVAFYDRATPVGGQFPVLIERAAYASESNNQGWTISAESTTGYSFRCYRNNGTASYTLTAGGYVRGDRVIIATSTGSSRATYRDGVQIATTGTNAAPLTTSSPVIVGGLGSNLEYIVKVAATWGRVLEAWEIAQITNDPFQLATLPGLPLVSLAAAFSPGAAAGGARSMVVVAG